MYSIKAPQVKLNVNGYMYNYTCPAACCVIAMHSVRMACQQLCNFIENSSISIVASDIPLPIIVPVSTSTSVKLEYSRIVLFKVTDRVA